MIQGSINKFSFIHFTFALASSCGHLGISSSNCSYLGQSQSWHSNGGLELSSNPWQCWLQSQASTPLNLYPEATISNSYTPKRYEDRFRPPCTDYGFMFEILYLTVKIATGSMRHNLNSRGIFITVNRRLSLFTASAFDAGWQEIIWTGYGCVFPSRKLKKSHRCNRSRAYAFYYKLHVYPLLRLECFILHCCNCSLTLRGNRNPRGVASKSRIV